MECGKGVKSLSGLSYHLYKCPVLVGKKTRYVVREDGDRQSLAGTQPYQSEADENGAEDIEDGDWIDTIEGDTTRLSHISPDQGRLSTTASMRIESYEEETGRKAGQISPTPEAPEGPPGHLSTYHPFQSTTDFAAAQWFLSAKCTKGDIERFYGDKRLEPVHRLLSFSSHDELLQKVHDIPYGIADDVWKISEIEVEQETIGLPPSTYVIRYRDIVKVLQFLMGHEPFECHLAYSPVR